MSVISSQPSTLSKITIIRGDSRLLNDRDVSVKFKVDRSLQKKSIWSSYFKYIHNFLLAQEESAKIRKKVLSKIKENTKKMTDEFQSKIAVWFMFLISINQI